MHSIEKVGDHVGEGLGGTDGEIDGLCVGASVSVGD